MDSHTLTVASLCAGAGGLDIAVKLALRNARTVLYCEHEAYAAARLVEQMQSGTLDDAPLWSDIKTLDGHPWRGVLDIVIGGYPCQPFSDAGKRLGEDDPRHLWPDFYRFIAESRPGMVFLENVRGHLTLGFGAVKRDLESLGYRVFFDLFSAAETGSTHRRIRLFILGVRMADSSRYGGDGQVRETGSGRRVCEGLHPVGHPEGNDQRRKRRGKRGRQSENRGSSCNVEQSASPRHETGRPGKDREIRDKARGKGPERSGGGMAYAGRECDERSGNQCIFPCPKASQQSQGDQRQRVGNTPCDSCAGMENSNQRRLRRPGTRPQQPGRTEVIEHVQALEHSEDPDRWTESEREGGDGPGPSGSIYPLWPPGPTDFEAWAEVLRTHPELAPAICKEGPQPPVCKLADGMAPVLAHRIDALCLVGNGVHPICGAFALLALLARYWAWAAAQPEAEIA